MRALGVVFALVLAFAAAVMILVAVDIGDTPTCDDVLSGEAFSVDCFDGSSGQKTISVALAWGSGIAGAIAAFLALAFAVTGRRGRLLVQVAGLAILLGGLSILIGSV
jgi:hypothetical protein